MKPEIVDYIYDNDIRFRTQMSTLKEEAIFIAKELKETYSKLTSINNSSYDVKVEFSNTVNNTYGNKNVSREYKFIYHIITDKYDIDNVIISTSVKYGNKVVIKFDLKWCTEKRFSVEIHTEMNNYDEITEEIALEYIERGYDYVLIFNTPKISKNVAKLLSTHDVNVYTGVSEAKLQRLLAKLSKKL